jgi:prepilin-type N-terminal cleavage/methylation domain-containing protein
VKILLRNRQNRGWSLLEILVAVAIAATLAAAGVTTYFQAFRANVRKAEMLISDIETLKQNLRTAIDSGEAPAPADEMALAAQILPSIKIQGLALIGNPQADAQTLGFSDLSVGTLDVEDSNGDVITPGTTASVTLNDGTVVTSASR